MARRTGVAATLVLHAFVVTAALSHFPARSAIRAAVPIMLTLVAPPPAAVSHPPPKPAPMRKPTEPAKRADPLPLVASTSAVPAPAGAPEPQVRDVPRIEASPPSPPAPAPDPAPAIRSPRFDAAYLQNPAPVYPPLSRRMGEKGRVMLRVLVSAEGSADRVEIKAGSGSARLDGAALEAVKQWRFVPASQGQRPIAAWVLVPISFSLEG